MKLTDEQREAIDCAIRVMWGRSPHEHMHSLDVLRALLNAAPSDAMRAPSVLTETQIAKIAHDCSKEASACPGTNMWQCAYMAVEETLKTLAEGHSHMWIAEVCEDVDGYKHIEAVIEDLEDMQKGMRLYGTPAADAAVAPSEDHECVYENGDGVCRECFELAKQPKPFGYARAIDYRITGQEPEDHELCCSDAPGAFPLYTASTPTVAADAVAPSETCAHDYVRSDHVCTECGEKAAQPDERAAFERTLSVEDSFRQADGNYLNPNVQVAWTADRTASDTAGMTLGERIRHVGGRTNGSGYIEFGSAMAVDALIQHALRDALRARAAVAQAGAMLTDDAELGAFVRRAVERLWDSPKSFLDCVQRAISNQYAAHPSTGEGKPTSQTGDAQ